MGSLIRSSCGLVCLKRDRGFTVTGRAALADVPVDDPARDGSVNRAWSTGSLAGQRATACDCAPVPVNVSTFFASLRIPKPEMISITPSTISQTPTTNAKVTIESNG
jgi:hypothetical protein